VLRFLPPEVEKAWSEARSAHSAGAYMAAEMMCIPGHKGWKDRRAVRPVAAARHGQECLLSASAQSEASRDVRDSAFCVIRLVRGLL
jgi:hypothetical protein